MKNFVNAAVLAAALFTGVATVSISANAASTSVMHAYWIGR